MIPGLLVVPPEGDRDVSLGTTGLGLPLCAISSQVCAQWPLVGPLEWTTVGIYTTEIGKYSNTKQVVKHSPASLCPPTTGTGGCCRVKAGLVFSGGNQVADHSDVGEELGDTLPTPAWPRLLAKSTAVVLERELMIRGKQKSNETVVLMSVGENRQGAGVHRKGAGLKRGVKPQPRGWRATLPSITGIVPRSPSILPSAFFCRTQTSLSHGLRLTPTASQEWTRLIHSDCHLYQLARAT